MSCQYAIYDFCDGESGYPIISSMVKLLAVTTYIITTRWPLACPCLLSYDIGGHSVPSITMVDAVFIIIGMSMATSCCLLGPDNNSHCHGDNGIFDCIFSASVLPFVYFLSGY